GVLVAGVGEPPSATDERTWTTPTPAPAERTRLRRRQKRASDGAHTSTTCAFRPLQPSDQIPRPRTPSPSEQLAHVLRTPATIAPIGWVYREGPPMRDRSQESRAVPELCARASLAEHHLRGAPPKA